MKSFNFFRFWDSEVRSEAEKFEESFSSGLAPEGKREINGLKKCKIQHMYKTACTSYM